MRTVNAELSRGRPDAVPVSGVRTFTILWCSQWLAVFATALSVLVLGLNIYAEFDSIVLLAIAYIILYVPFVLLSPFAGALVDRWGHKRVLLISNVGTLANTSVLLAFLLMHALGLWEAITILGVAAILKGLQLAAVESVVPLLVPKRHLGRANSPRMLLTSTGVIIGPFFVGLLLLVVEPIAIIMLECAALALAIVVLSTVRIPPVPAADGDASRGSLRTEILGAWATLRTRRGLLPVLGFLAAISGVIAVLEVASSESVYAFAQWDGLVIVLSTGWVGMLLASIAMLVWGWPRRLVPGMLGAGLAFAAALVVGALRPNIVVMAIAAFIALAGAAVIVAVVQTMLHTKVEPHLLGRAIGLKNATIGCLHITGNLTVTVLGAALVPVVGRDDVRSPVVAAFVGHGPGRAWAVLMLAVGLLTALAVFVASRNLRLRHVQADLPDMTPEDRPAAIAPTPGATAPVSPAPAPAQG